jgi:hypothetical protein
LAPGGRTSGYTLELDLHPTPRAFEFQLTQLLAIRDLELPGAGQPVLLLSHSSLTGQRGLAYEEGKLLLESGKEAEDKRLSILLVKRTRYAAYKSRRPRPRLPQVARD